MILFWVIVAVMIALSLAALLPPLLGRGRDTGIPRDQLNIAIYNERVAELGADFSRGHLTQGQYEETKRELERELLADVSGSAKGAAPVRPSRSPVTAVLVAVAVPLLSVGLYLKLGDPRLLGERGPAGSPTEAQRAMPSISDMVAKLERRLKDEPKDATGWMMLGRSYVVLHRYGEASDAYAKAYALVGDDPALMADWAEAAALANNGQLGGRPAELVDKVLATQPDNMKGLWLGGMAAFQAGDYKHAAERWGRLAPKVPAQTDDGRLVRDYLGQARSHLSPEELARLAPEGTPSAAEDGTSKAGLKVEVTFAPALAGRVSPNDTVFVFARAASGPRMPLAVLRSPARDLPATVTLDDSMAMAPAFKLSSFPQVVVGARISKTGNATPEAGDLQGLSAPVASGSQGPVRVVVDQVVGENSKAMPESAPIPAEAAVGQSAPAAGAPPGASEPSPEGVPGKVVVRVTLDSALAGRVTPEETVFIFARAAQGPRMPLAIARKQVKDLPATVTLDDAMAMAPAFRLSLFPEVTVAARVSRAGNAMPQPGDLEGLAAGVRVGGAPVSLAIDHVVP